MYILRFKDTLHSDMIFETIKSARDWANYYVKKGSGKLELWQQREDLVDVFTPSTQDQPVPNREEEKG